MSLDFLYKCSLGEMSKIPLNTNRSLLELFGKTQSNNSFARPEFSSLKQYAIF
jgi:hypothetical protein